MAKNPLTIVLENKKFQLVPTLPKGLILYLSGLYFDAGAPQIQEKDYGLILGVDVGIWLRYKERILPVLREVLPRLQKMAKKEQITTNNRLKALEKAHNVVNKAYLEKRALESLKSTTFSENLGSHVKINPVLLSPEKYRHHEGEYDHVARAAALKSNKKPVQGWMTEKPKT